MINNLDCSGSDRFMARYQDRYCYGGGDNTSTQQSTSAPSAFAQPYLTDLMSQAKTLYNQGSQYAPFSTVAPFSDQTLQGLNMTQNAAQQGSPLTDAAGGSLTNLLQARTAPGAGTLQSLMGGYSDPGQSTMSQWANTSNINPYLDAQYKAASQPVTDSVNSQFSQAGRTGSTANQNALTDRLGALSANIYGTGYENAANRSMTAAGQLSSAAGQQANIRGNAANMLNSYDTSQGNQRIAAATLAPTLDNQQYAGAQNMLNVGGAYDSQANKYIQDALSRWNYGQDQPWNLLSRYAGNTAGLGNLGTTTTGTTTAPSPSILPSLAGAGVNLLGSPTSSGGSLFSNLLGY